MPKGITKPKSGPKTNLEIAKQALRDIVNPLEKLKRELPVGSRLDGPMTVRLIESPAYLKDIALEALRQISMREVKF